jgi:hypothetical protein
MKKRSIFGLLPLLIVLFVLGSVDLEAKKQPQVAVKLVKLTRTPAFSAEVQIKGGNLYDGPEMAVIWLPTPRGFKFRIYNKQQEEIVILWNECLFIDEKGNSHKVTHKGVKRRSNLPNDMKALNPTVVQVKGNWQDVIFPFDADYIEHDKELTPFSKEDPDTMNKYGKAGLRMKPIFIDTYKGKHLKKVKKNIKKKKFADFKAYLDTLNYEVVLALKVKKSEPRQLYRFFFKTFLIEK